MWRTSVLLLAVACLEFTSAGTQTTDGLLVQRLKRSPGYYRHRHWPGPPPSCRGDWPPPPPDFWPPPSSGQEREQEPSSQYRNEPCTENCEMKSHASGSISNAKSRTGDAIAVAVSKGKKAFQ